MKTVSVINYKGGVGKTTVTANLAAEMAHRGKKVLVIDLDPQTNLTFCFMTPEEWQLYYEKDKTIKSWFNAILRDKPNKPHFKDLTVKKCGIDIICSHLGLIEIDVHLAAGLGATFHQPWKYINTYSYIKRELSTLSDVYDIVLLDCPPNFSTVTRNALVASDYYVIPAKMDYLSTLGINQLRGEISNELVEPYNKRIDEDDECSKADYINPEFLGVIATMVKMRDYKLIDDQQRYKNQLIYNDITVFKNMVRESKIFPESMAQHKPTVLQYYYQDSYRNMVRELEQLTDEFMQRVGL